MKRSPIDIIFYYFLLFNGIFFSFNLQAQPAGMQNFLLEEGSMSPKINCLIQTSRDYLAIGSTRGLYLFKGQTFEKIPLDSFIGSENISAIAEIRPGEIWVGFQNGALAVVYANRVVPLHFEEGKFGKAITSIITDSAGNTWCGTAGEGVYCYHLNHWVNYDTDDGMTDAYVYDLAVAGREQVFCATDDGINVCGWQGGKKSIRTARAGEQQLDKITRRLLPYTPGLYLAGTQDYLTGFFSTADLLVKSLLPVPLRASQTNAMVRSQQHVWIATENDGLSYFDFKNATPSLLSLQNWKPRNKVQHLLVDKWQHLWLTTDNELIKTEGDRLSIAWSFDQQSYRDSHAILVTKGRASEGRRLLYNDERGLNEIIDPDKPATRRLIHHPVAGISHNTGITCLYEDEPGNIWIGTLGKGILVLDKKTGRISSVEDNPLLVKGSILSITGKGKDIWISSLGGAVKCTLEEDGKTRSFINYTEISGIGTNYIYNILIDSRNRVWFATDGKGITKLENGNFTNYNKSSGLKGEVIYSLAENPDGTIWCNSLNDGIYRFDGNTFRNFSVADGLSDNNISSILADGKGNIVAFSAKAIDVINPASGAIQTFNQQQGIQEINTDLHAATVSSDGDVYSCTSNGIFLLHTLQGLEQPRAYIEKTSLFLNAFDAATRQEFASEENNISVYFNAIDLSHPESIRYQYMLKGLSEAWVTTRDHYINFPKLLPGDYSFRVRASLSGSFALAPEAVYSFHINLPLWQRRWFILTVLLLLGTAIWLLVRVRVQRARQWQQLQKENLQSRLDTLQSQVSPHFFFNSLNTLIALIEEDPETAVAYTNHLSDFFRKIVQYREKDRIPLAEETELINDYFFIQKKRFGSGIRFVNHVPAQVMESRKIAPLSLQLLAENAMKHNAFTREEPLILELSVINNDWLEVKNNIRPRQTAETGEGLGLQNIQRRYRLLTGKEIVILNDSVSFIVRIPLI